MHAFRPSNSMAAFIIVFVIVFQSALPSVAFTSPTHHTDLNPATTSVGSQRLVIPCIKDYQSKSAARLNNNYRPRNNYHRYRNSCALNLVPVSEAWDANNDNEQPFSTLLPTLGSSFNSEGMLIHSTDEENKRYRLYLTTDVDDLPSIAKLTLDVFDATAITLSSTTDWSAIEQVLVGPAIGMYNAYAQAVGYTEVLSGLRRRMRNRISDNGNNDWLAPLIVPDAASSSNNNPSSNQKETTLEDIAARSSLILALARPFEGEEDMEVVASVELRLQPTDAKIPFSQPWLDTLERRLVGLLPFVKDEPTPIASTIKSATSDNGVTAVSGTDKSENPPLRPYLCNLCVSPSLRSLGIGRALCRIVEAIAHEKWGYSHMYLHVDPENDAARGLYEKDGYADVGRRWDVIWAGGANEISYYVKRLGR